MNILKDKTIQELVMTQPQTQSPGKAPSQTPTEAHTKNGDSEEGRQR